MSARERILTIRLLDKAARHPAYAAALGIECVQEQIRLDDLGKPPESAQLYRKRKNLVN